MDTFELLPVLAAGDLSQTSAPELVAAIYRSRASGTLALEGEGREEIRLFFKLGNSCGAGKPAGFRSLAEILLSQKMLTPEQAERAAAESSVSGKRLGEVLVGMRLLQPDQLLLALATQHRENLRLMLIRNVGRYEWRGWEPPPVWAGEVTVDPTRAILEALALPQLGGRRGAVLRWLGDAQIHASHDFAELATRAELLVADRRAAELCATPMTAEQLLAATGLPRQRAEALLVTLLLVGAAEPVPSEASQPLDASLFEPVPPELPEAAFELSPPPPPPVRTPTPPAPVPRAVTPPAPVPRVATPSSPPPRVSTPPPRQATPPSSLPRVSTPPPRHTPPSPQPRISTPPPQRSSQPPAPQSRAPTQPQPRVPTSPQAQRFVPPPPPAGFDLDADEIRVDLDDAELRGPTPLSAADLFDAPAGPEADPLSMAADAADGPEHVLHERDADPALSGELAPLDHAVEAVAQLDFDDEPAAPVYLDAAAQDLDAAAREAEAAAARETAAREQAAREEAARRQAEADADFAAFQQRTKAALANGPGVDAAAFELAPPADDAPFELVSPAEAALGSFAAKPMVDLDVQADEPMQLVSDLDLVQPPTQQDGHADPFAGSRAPSGSGYLLPSEDQAAADAPLELVPAHEPIEPAPPSSSALRKKLLSVGMRNLRGPIELEDEQAGNQAAAELREELAPLPLTDEERCYLEDVRARLKVAARQDAYARLGVSQGASQDQLRTAYLQLVKKFHPDRAQSSPGLRQAAPDLDALFGFLREAYERVGSAEARKQYDASGKTSTKQKNKSEEATLSLRKGEVYLKKRDYESAFRELRRAVDLDPTAETLAGLAWGLVSDRSQTSTGVREEALKLVARALKLDQRNGRAHYVAGVLRRTTEPDAALEHFRRCVEIDPRNADAALEVRLLERRREKSNTGPLGRLFKRDGK